MAGFGKVTFVGEYYNQPIVNILHYRSSAWLPGGGNPFDDVLAFVLAATNAVSNPLLSCLPSDYTLLRVEGVGYDDAYNIVTASPLVHTVGSQGALIASQTSGAAQACNIGLRCGAQVQINGTGHSKRNRGYLCLGPIGEAYIDNYSHLDSGFVSQRVDLLAIQLMAVLHVTAPAADLQPIRVHEKWTKDIFTGRPTLAWRTYSDILGYTLPHLGSYRRSRKPQA